MWDQAKTEWIKLCPKSSDPHIRVYADQSNKIVISVADNTNSIKLKHIMPDNFKEKASKLSCQWIASHDCIQNDAITVSVFFKTSETFKHFVDLFKVAKCLKILSPELKKDECANKLNASESSTDNAMHTENIQIDAELLSLNAFIF